MKYRSRKRRPIQGVFYPTKPKKYVGKSPIIYRSSWELKFCRWCDVNENVLEWSSESIVIPYINPVTGRGHRYFVDNTVIIREGAQKTKYLIEIKPKKQTKKPKFSTRKKRSTMIYESNLYVQNQAKWEAAEKWSKKKGYKFIILTEDDLFCNK